LPDLAIATPVDGGAASAQVLAELDKRARREGDAIGKRLAERLARLQVSSQLLRFDESMGSLCATLAELARCADLFIATRPYSKTDLVLWDELVEAVLFGGGRALLLVPPGRRRQISLQTVLVAWNGSREAARAVSEGLPFIEKAARNIVLVVDPEPESDPATGIVGHLARHGVTAEVITSESRGRRVGDTIIDEARRKSADLIVMGGYGHTRLRERVFGGATLDMLTLSESAVLMAH
jgi:nucleotide-binding universal stress UspA family protein